MENQINHGEMYEDLMPQASPKSQYSLSTRIEARIKYAWEIISPLRILERVADEAIMGLCNLPIEPPKTLEYFLRQVQKRQETRNYCKQKF